MNTVIFQFHYPLQFIPREIDIVNLYASSLELLVLPEIVVMVAFSFGSVENGLEFLDTFPDRVDAVAVKYLNSVNGLGFRFQEYGVIIIAFHIDVIKVIDLSGFLLESIPLIHSRDNGPDGGRSIIPALLSLTGTELDLLDIKLDLLGKSHLVLLRDSFLLFLLAYLLLS